MFQNAFQIGSNMLLYHYLFLCSRGEIRLK